MNRNRLSVTLALLLFVYQSPLTSAELRSPSFAPWSIGFTPGISLPLGADVSFFQLGGGSQLDVGYRLPQLPWLHLAGEFGYDFVPVSFGTSVSVLSLGLAADLTVYVTPWLALSGSISGGYYYGLLNSGAGPRSSNPYIQPGIGVALLLSPTFRLGIDAAYRSFLGLYSCFGVAGNMTLYFGGERASGTESSPPRPLAEGENAENIQIRNVVFTEIFPVFFKHYEDHPIGNAIIRNNTKQQIQEIAIDMFIKQYMDNPQRCVAPVELKPGEEKQIELNALLTEKVLEVTERTKVSAEITVSYRIGKEKHTELYVDTVRIYDRNAITWDDDRRAAAFVTEKDPTVLWFSKNVASMIDVVENRQINSNLQIAMAIHLALAEFGMSYAVDPATPYMEFSRTKNTVDFLQFPSETLGYKAGDCDDLSILACALLQSRGLKTAFITIPGHIFMAFALGMTPDEARAKFSRADEFIFQGEDSWIPVEITEIKGGFIKAWQTGVQEWREYEAKKQALFYPMRDAWTVYEPTGFAGDRADIQLPTPERVVSAFKRELEIFINREIYAKAAEFTEEIAKSGSITAINKLGVLYATYGLVDRAESEFRRILERSEHVPALMNLGNIYYLRKDMKKSLEYYRRASQKEPNNARVLLALARASNEMENYADSREYYTKLKEIDPNLAGRYVFLDLKGDDASRAGAVGRLKEEVLWEQ